MTQQIAPRLLSWASVLEDSTREQAEKSSTMPFINPHIALMPDAHLGLGATVGSVIPTVGAIMPAAVGVDIGCGMMAVRTGVHGDLNEAARRKLHEAISGLVPLSMGGYNQQIDDHAAERIDQLVSTAGNEQADMIAPNWTYQLGSLGSGNHFIEVSHDETGDIWLFLHSGSRGVGNKLATKYVRLAQKQCKKRWIQLPHPDLAYLVEGDNEFWDYMEALRWALRFALLNREVMMERVKDASHDVFGFWVPQETINCHHNYTEKEHHFGKDVWLSRKGAILATEGTPGLIPGSMGTASYVVEGKGNRLALNSSPHGAGRNYSRRKARETFTREDLDERMAGITWGQSDDFLDEHPLAYKDIDQVMADSADLVTVRHALHQFINVKGS